MSALKENVETTDNSILLKNRRFVGVKETVAYVLEDTAQSLNINDFKERYIYDVVKIDFSYLAIQNIVATVWDTFNDTFIGVENEYSNNMHETSELTFLIYNELMSYVRLLLSEKMEECLRNNTDYPLLSELR